jgi:protein gp37
MTPQLLFDIAPAVGVGPELPRWEKVHTNLCGKGTYTFAGWTVEHCGHPTANFPYMVYTPEGRAVLAPNGRAFQTLAAAKAEVERRGEALSETLFDLTPQPLKLSDAILAGARIRPQAFGSYFTGSTRSDACSCSIGAAYEVTFPDRTLAHDKVVIDFDRLAEHYPLLKGRGKALLPRVRRGSRHTRQPLQHHHPPQRRTQMAARARRRVRERVRAMSEHTHIQWTDATWNILAGCSKVSPGCKNCYAIPHAHRMAGNPNAKISEKYAGTTTEDGRNWTGRVNFAEHLLEWPLHKQKPLRIFVNAMSDLFHEDANPEDVRRIFAVMMVARRHTFQILTKRPERMAAFFRENSPNDCYVEQVTELRRANDFSLLTARLRSLDRFGELPGAWPLPNVWLGVSVENQQTADDRIPKLLETPAAVRWLSVEPLLGAVDLYRHLEIRMHDLNGPDETNIHWVVVGGESGKAARPMHPDWARSLRDQCVAAGVPFFFKQAGEWAPIDEPWKQDSPKPLTARERWMNIEGGHGFHGGAVWRMRRVGKNAAGCLLDGAEWNQYPEVARA